MSRHLKAFRILEHLEYPPCFPETFSITQSFFFKRFGFYIILISCYFPLILSLLKDLQRPRTCLRLFRSSCRSGEPCTKAVHLKSIKCFERSNLRSIFCFQRFDSNVLPKHIFKQLIMTEAWKWNSWRDLIYHMVDWYKWQIEMDKIFPKINNRTDFLTTIKMSASVHNENFRRDSLFIQANTERTLLYPFARVRLSEHIGTRLSKMHEQRSKMRNNCKNLNSLIQM